MRLLLDTHVLLWAAYRSSRLPASLRDELVATDNEILVSAASIWEISIKASLGRADFTVDPRLLRRGMTDAGYVELSVTASHALAVADLPRLHGDPFDRILIAQARSEGLTLVTADAAVAAYGSPARLI